MVTPRTWPILL
jgi:hypothetical protein